MAPCLTASRTICRARTFSSSAKAGVFSRGSFTPRSLARTFSTCQIERGERNLTYKNVLKLARGLGVDPSELMPGDGGS